jgi:hypothetical protein
MLTITDKTKPAVRQGRKVTGLLKGEEKIAELPGKASRTVIGGYNY